MKKYLIKNKNLNLNYYIYFLLGLLYHFIIIITSIYNLKEPIIFINFRNLIIIILNKIKKY